jgi:hypothetical protein
MHKPSSLDFFSIVFLTCFLLMVLANTAGETRAALENTYQVKTNLKLSKMAFGLDAGWGDFFMSKSGGNRSTTDGRPI